jgi:hypothetical protein
MMHFYIMQNVLTEAQKVDINWANKHNVTLESLFGAYRGKGGQVQDKQ